jgi:hypothetical protein
VRILIGKNIESNVSTFYLHKNVINAIRAGTEGVLEDAARLENNFRVVTRGLASRATIKVPLGEGIYRFALLNVRREKRTRKQHLEKERLYVDVHTDIQVNTFLRDIPWRQEECES